MATTDGSDMPGDDFFDVVRRRHPDIDIVLLPPAAEPVDGSADPTADLAEPIAPGALDGIATEVATEVADLWSSVTGGMEMSQVTSRWTYGDVLGSLSRESLVAAVGMDDVTAHQALARAERILDDLSWHTLAPGDGMPRVLASRLDDDAGRECQIVYVAETGRLAMSYSAGPYVVGETAARAKVTETR